MATITPAFKLQNFQINLKKLLEGFTIDDPNDPVSLAYLNAILLGAEWQDSAAYIVNDILSDAPVSPQHGDYYLVTDTPNVASWFPLVDYPTPPEIRFKILWWDNTVQRPIQTNLYGEWQIIDPQLESRILVWNDAATDAKKILQKKSRIAAPGFEWLVAFDPTSTTLRFGSHLSIDQYPNFIYYYNSSGVWERKKLNVAISRWREDIFEAFPGQVEFELKGNPETDSESVFAGGSSLAKGQGYDYQVVANNFIKLDALKWDLSEFNIVRAKYSELIPNLDSIDFKLEKITEKVESDVALNDIIIKYEAVPKSTIIDFNGQHLKEDVDYTISGRNITLDPAVAFGTTVGDKLSINYARLDFSKNAVFEKVSFTPSNSLNVIHTLPSRAVVGTEIVVHNGLFLRRGALHDYDFTGTPADKTLDLTNYLTEYASIFDNLLLDPEERTVDVYYLVNNKFSKESDVEATFGPVIPVEDVKVGNAPDDVLTFGIKFNLSEDHQVDTELITINGQKLNKHIDYFIHKNYVIIRNEVGYFGATDTYLIRYLKK